MKALSFKTIFIFIIVILITFAIYNNYHKNNATAKNENTLNEMNDEKTIATDLRIGIVEFDNINPILSNNKNVQDVSRLIYDPLVTLTEDYKLEPCLATEWTRTGDKTYLIKLRENVLWQDGKTFNSSDVEFTIDMLKREDIHSVYSYNVSKIQSVEIIDEYTIRIEISEEDLFFEYNLIFPIMSSKYFGNYNEFISEAKNRKPVGTGMFYVSEADNYTVTLKKNTNWWDIKNKNAILQNITLNLYESMTSMFTDFKNSKLDILTTSNLNIQNYIGESGYLKFEYINRNYTYLALNCNHNILSDTGVRRALAMAIDKKDIIKDVYYEKYVESNFPLDYGNYAYQSENNKIQYNQDNAQTELINSGWSYEQDYWRKKYNNKNLKIDLKLVINEENKEHLKIGEKIIGQLENIGVHTKLEKCSHKEYEKYLQNKNYDIILLEKNFGYSPDVSNYFKEGNVANFNNENVNHLLNEFKYLSEEKDIQNNCSEIAKIYNEQCPYISLFYNINTMVYSKELKGKVSPNSYNLFYHIHAWYRECEN